MGFADPSPTRPKGIARGLGAVTSNKMRSVIGAIESAGIPTVDYDKLLAMFEGKHSKILVTRHAAAITRVCATDQRLVVSLSAPRCPGGEKEKSGNGISRVVAVLTVGENIGGGF